jgi:O-antigen ligase
MFLLLIITLFFHPLISSSGHLFENEFIKLLLLYFYSAAFLLIYSLNLLKKKQLTLPSKTLTLLIIFFLTTTLISSLFGLSSKDSLLGRYGLWQTSFLTFIVYTLIFYSSFLIFLDKKKHEYFYLSILIPSLIVSLTEIIYRFQNNIFSTTRMSAYFENPNLFGFYLCLILNLSLFLALTATSKIIKIISFLSFPTSFLALVFTQSRLSWLVAVISIFINLFIFRHLIIKKINRYHLLFISLIFLVILGLTFPLIENRLNFDSNSPRSSLKLRLKEWQTVLLIYQKHPFLGIGPENLDIIYPRFRDKDMNLIPEEWQWRSLLTRNLWLEFLVTKGPLGVISFIFLGIFFFRQFLTLKSAIPALSLIVAYYLHSLLYFETVTVDLLFFVSLGFLASFQKPKTIKTNIIPGIILLCLSLLSFFVFSRVLISEYLSKQAVIHLETNPNLSLSLAKESFSLNPVFDKNLRLLCLSQSESIRKETIEKSLMINDYADCLHNLEKRNQGDLENLKSLTSGHMRLASYQNSLYNRALDFGQKLINLDPTSPGSYDTLGLVYLDSRQYEKALSTFNFVIASLKPDYPFAHFHLGETYRQLGEPEKALPYYYQALKLGYQGAIGEIDETVLEIKAKNKK